MEKVVMVRVTEGFNPFEVLEDIRSIGFKFDHLLPQSKDSFLLVGEMDINRILLLRVFEGVDSFSTAPGIRKN